ncbi:ABC transporter ATP-binding protein [Amycolatopsis regifaucium]|uniref:Multidrug ABC transporter permease n=1 Tax=Amycolatopsis regifaucium TaxID=546365 RepID=A0A154MWJ5_9PSEU|nr:ABC transporter ATP-binding protein [Amycolatopsis regifaucium]KZB88370.1 multidrug ABC transporter permease [Amycolatopsis regifaucium]OKA11482.1 multidrug ABC transporter permease [Amycolatopsis regifaucium]SFH40591.1 ATP-binding cassette, subfamily B [Amycolatopsis regifaucium]
MSAVDPVRAGVRHLRAAIVLAFAANPAAATGQLAVALLAGAAPVAVAWLTRTVLDGIAAGSGRSFVSLALALVLVGVCAAVLPNVERYLRAELDRSVGILARDRLFGALERLRGLRRLEDPNFHDRLQLAADAGRASPPSVLSGVVELARGAITVIGFAVSLLLIGPFVTVIVLIGALPVGIAEFALARQRARMMWEVEPAQRRELFYAQLLSGPRAAKEVRLFGLGRFFRTRMVTELRGIYGAERVLDRRELRVQGLLAVLSAGIAGYGLFWVVGAAANGSVSVGDLAVFVAAVAGIQAALASGVDQAARMHQALLLFDHYVFVTAVTGDLPVSATPIPVPPLRRGIELRDVWFRYSEDHPWVLRGVTLTIPVGSALALVGHNGAGKSTVIKLLCRLYDPDRGSIHWDGVDLRAFDPDELRTRIGAVFQDYMDYDLTAAENIAVGDLDALTDESRLRAAARRAGAHEFIEALPRGYETMLSRIFTDNIDRDDPSTGVVLSGGQLQRLALARAFLRDRRDLLILDEPSAGLDAEAEADIHTRLRAHRADRTSVLISHRLGAVRDADVIAVLSDGRVTEVGDHHGLISSRGIYHRLYTLQAKGYHEEVALP